MATFSTKINRINNAKEQEAKALNELKIDYLTTIYEKAVKGYSYTDIHKEIFAQTINFKKAQGFYSETLLHNADKLIKKAVAQRGFIALPIRGALSVAVAEIVVNALGQDKVLDILSQNVYAELDKRESERKKKTIEEELKDNNLEASVVKSVKAKIFYLCSTHEDSALDHKPYQGKMYVTSKWQRLISDNSIKAQVDNYIRQNDVKTFEWVTGKPVYMITRPNCRHYFNTLTVEDVFSLSVDSLLDKYHMKHEVGTRDIRQTLKDKYVADIKSIDTIIAKYIERLALHTALNKKISTPLLKEAIAKDKLLIAKWKEKRKSLINRSKV